MKNADISEAVDTEVIQLQARVADLEKNCEAVKNGCKILASENSWLRDARNEALAKVKELEAAQTPRPMSEAPRSGRHVWGVIEIYSLSRKSTYWLDNDGVAHCADSFECFMEIQDDWHDRAKRPPNTRTPSDP